MESVGVWNALIVVVLTAIGYRIFTKILYQALWKPLRYRRIMTKQGVPAPPFKFITGQMLEFMAYRESFPEVVPLDSYKDYSPTVTPAYALYFPQFPDTKYFLYEHGKSTRLVIRDAEIAREVFYTNHPSLGRYKPEDDFLFQILGTGLVTSMGEKWQTERKTINPFFNHDGLKGMIAAMVDGTKEEIDKWEKLAAEGGGSAEIDLEPDIHRLSGRVLSLTVFGGEQYKTGVKIYEIQSDVSALYFKMLRKIGYWLIPRYRHIPTKDHKHMNESLELMNKLLKDLIHGRREAVRKGITSSFGDNLLGCMLSSITSESWDPNSLEFNLSTVMNNCKLFYFAGQDTVVNGSLFMLLMLSLYPEWQDRCRQEVLEVVGDDEHFDPRVLVNLKVVNMVIHETLRTFTPAPTVTRMATKDLHLKNGLMIPKGITVEYAMSAVHQDKDYWGEDVAKFNPSRFENGMLKAVSHPQAFVPFGLGPKTCIGLNYAQMEIKIIMARILRRFEVLPSPNYKHHPTAVILTQPKYGMPIILKALKKEAPLTPEA